MPERINNALDLKIFALEAQKAERREHSDNRKNLETKAQGAGAIAGIFLAAIFAWARDPQGNLTGFENILLTCSVVLLVFSIISAVFALIVRRVRFPPIGSMDGGIMSDLLRIDKEEELVLRIPAFINDQIRLWQDANENIRNQNATKAKYIGASQIAILAAACVVAGLTIIAVFG